MDVRVEFRQTHRYSFTRRVDGGFKVTFISMDDPVSVQGLYYILVIDTSGSMAGEKLEAAKKAAKRLVELLPSGNRVSIIRFSSGVRVLVREADSADKELLYRTIDMLSASGSTHLLRALREAMSLAGGRPAYMVLLSDGQPTDGSRLSDYVNLEMPSNIKPVVIGIGTDYNERILSAIADRGGGIFAHVSEARIEELVERFEEVAAVEGYAKDVSVRVESVGGEARLLGYEGLEARIPVMRDSILEVYGEVAIPEGYSGVVARVYAEYTDIETGERKRSVFEYRVRPAETREEFLSGIDKTLQSEVMYYKYMDEVRRLVREGALEQATQRLQLAEAAAAATQKLDLVEATQRLKGTIEATMRLSGRAREEATRKLQEEATRSLRRL